MIAVSGAEFIPARTPPIPHNEKTTGSSGTLNRSPATTAKMKPRKAPMLREGANFPPYDPARRNSERKTTFSTRSTVTSVTGSSPASTSLMVLYPIP